MDADSSAIRAEELMDHAEDDAREAGQPEGRYANYFQVGPNAFEFLFDFGQFYPEGQEAHFHTRVVTGPVYALAFFETLRESIGRYEQTFGTIAKGDQ